MIQLISLSAAVQKNHKLLHVIVLNADEAKVHK